MSFASAYGPPIVDENALLEFGDFKWLHATFEGVLSRFCAQHLQFRGKGRMTLAAFHTKLTFASTSRNLCTLGSMITCRRLRFF